MADFARFLPLSMRGHEDESSVGSDRREAFAVLVEIAATIVDAAGSRASAVAHEFAGTAKMQKEWAELPAGAAAARLAALATVVRTGPRRSIRSLSHAARALLVLGLETGVAVELPSLTAGAVALYAATSAPLERRAVVRGHTVRASDADWGFGTGPVLTASGTAIAAFLLGVSDNPPQPLNPRR